MNSDTIIYICGFIVAVDRVFDICLKYKNRATSDITALTERVTNIEGELEKMQGFLDNDKHRLDATEKGAAVVQKAILALIDNALDNSNKEPLFEAKSALNDFLVNRQLER